jgi:hypothetical protein
MFTLREQERETIERLRGWMVYFLYKQRPRALEASVLMRLLDRRNFPLSRRRLAEEIDYLASIRLIRAFTAEDVEELDSVQQAKLIQKYSACESDAEMGSALLVRITAAGVNFQEGVKNWDGLQRVE